MTFKTIGMAMILGFTLTACSTGGGAPTLTAAAKPAPQERIQAVKEQDRAAIIAMAGDYSVTFDFEEKVAFQEGYTLKEPKLSKATEIVRVIENRADFISLQHILVVGNGIPVKHWRQDWEYQPTEMLSFVGFNSWEVVDVASNESVGAWSQTVYQVDDSPRYAGVGVWQHQDGASIWEAAPSMRPLPRRDATTRNDYHAIRAVNRHAITPTGWVHEQDNQKLVLADGVTRLIAHEVGVNTYTEGTSVNIQPALAYWEGTKDYWAAVRSMWNQLENTQSRFVGLTMEGEPEALYAPVMAIAEEYKDGKLTLKEAIAEAREALAENTVTKRAASNLSRLSR